MDFEKLHLTLEEIYEEIKDIPLIVSDRIINPIIETLLNDKDYYITMHDLEFVRPLFINNLQKEYYGFGDNHFTKEDYLFYFLTLHPSSYSSLFSSIIHFKNGGKGYLNLEYKLKKHNGRYEMFYGSTKSIFINEKIKYAITVLQKKQKKAERNINKIYAVSLLTEREKQIALLYCENKTALEISAELNISINTTKTHLKSIYKKLEINNVKELINEMKLIYP